MKYLRYVTMFAALMLLPLACAQAQVRIGVGIGPVGVGVGVAPVCPYGYYPDYPYACAPYGYYGPEWFSGGVFIGAGPWYHGWGRPYFDHGVYRPGFYGRGGLVGRGYNGHGVVPRGGGGHAIARSGGGFRSAGGFHGGGGHGR
ncbi:MAG: hypothetical protein WBS24_00225 [Terriglobales bacterium]